MCKTCEQKVPGLSYFSCIVFFFFEPVCSEQDIVVTTINCLCMCVCVFVRQSEFVWTITFTTVDGFQNNLKQLFSIMCRLAFERFGQVGPRSRSYMKVKFFSDPLTLITLDGFHNKFAKLFSIISRCAIRVGQRSKSCRLDKLFLDNLLVFSWSALG